MQLYNGLEGDLNIYQLSVGSRVSFRNILWLWWPFYMRVIIKRLALLEGVLVECARNNNIPDLPSYMLPTGTAVLLLWVRKQENQNDCSPAKLPRGGGLRWRSDAIAVQSTLSRAFFDIGYKVMWLLVWKIAPPFLLKPDIQPSEMSFGVKILACVWKLLGSNTVEESASSEVVLACLGLCRYFVLTVTPFTLHYSLPYSYLSFCSLR